MRLIRAGRQLISAERLVSVTEPAGKRQPYVIEYNDGAGIARIETDHLDVEALEGDIVPATPGYKVL